MPSKVFDRAIFGCIATPVLHLADRCGMFAHLVAAGEARAIDVAVALGLDEDSVDRMLLVLTAFELVHRDAAGVYSLPADVQPFVDQHDERYLGGFVEHLVQVTTGQVARLGSHLEHGKAAVDTAAPFELLYKDEAALHRFTAAMWDLSYAPSGELAMLAKVGEVGHLVDVGGGCGPFAIAALRTSSDLRATVFDLPMVEPSLVQRRAEHDVAGRLAFVGGDFFTDELPPADCFAFGYVLSDWDDDTCVDLLTKAYRACTVPGRVLVMERLFDDDLTGPLATSVMNLTMQLETRGRHRTAVEYSTLLTEAGFTDCEVRRSSTDKHLILARK